MPHQPAMLSLLDTMNGRSGSLQSQCCAAAVAQKLGEHCASHRATSQLRASQQPRTSALLRRLYGSLPPRLLAFAPHQPMLPSHAAETRNRLPGTLAQELPLFTAKRHVSALQLELQEPCVPMSKHDLTKLQQRDTPVSLMRSLAVPQRPASAPDAAM